MWPQVDSNGLRNILHPKLVARVPQQLLPAVLLIPTTLRPLVCNFGMKQALIQIKAHKKPLEIVTA